MEEGTPLPIFVDFFCLQLTPIFILQFKSIIKKKMFAKNQTTVSSTLAELFMFYEIGQFWTNFPVISKYRPIFEMGILFFLHTTLKFVPFPKSFGVRVLRALLHRYSKIGWVSHVLWNLPILDDRVKLKRYVPYLCIPLFKSKLLYINSTQPKQTV